MRGMSGQTATLPPVSSLLRARPATMPRNNSLSRGSSSPPCSPRTPATELDASTADLARASGSTSPAFAALSLDVKRRPPPLNMVSLRPSPPTDRTSPGDERRSISSLLNGIRAADPDAPPLHPESSNRERTRNGRYHVAGPPPLSSGPPDRSNGQPPSPDRFPLAPPHTAPMRSSVDSAAPVPPHYVRPNTGHAPPPPASEYHWPPPPGALTRRHSYHPVEYYPPPHHPAYFGGYPEGVYVSPPGMGPYDALGGFGAIGARAPISRTTKACDSCRARKVRCDAGGGLPGRPHPCSRCRESARPCHYSATQKKRGPCPGRPVSSRRGNSAGLGSERPVTGHDMPRGDARDWERGSSTAPGSAHGRPPRSAPARPVDPWPWGNGPHPDDRYHPYARPPTAPHASHPHVSPPRERAPVPANGWDGPGPHGPHGPPPPPGYPPNAAPRHAPSAPMFDAHYSMHPHHPGSQWAAPHPAHGNPHGPPPPPHLAPPAPNHGRRHDYPRRSISPAPRR